MDFFQSQGMCRPFHRHLHFTMLLFGVQSMKDRFQETFKISRF